MISLPKQQKETIMPFRNVWRALLQAMRDHLTELRGFLGPGYALIVANLTALTRGQPGKIKLTPEAIIEFGNIKAVLASPYDTRKTIVYTDASVGTQDGTGSGGLGIVVVEADEGSEYLCCFASCGLTTAQKNYHIVRLELLALVFACGKFHEWLEICFKEKLGKGIYAEKAG